MCRGTELGNGIADETRASEVNRIQRTDEGRERLGCPVEHGSGQRDDLEPRQHRKQIRALFCYLDVRQAVPHASAIERPEALDAGHLTGDAPRDPGPRAQRIGLDEDDAQDDGRINVDVQRPWRSSRRRLKESTGQFAGRNRRSLTAAKGTRDGRIETCAATPAGTIRAIGRS